MAIRTLYSASFAGDAVTFAVTFDDQTLLLQQLDYMNSTAQTAALNLVGPVKETISLPANAPATQVSLVSANVSVVATQVFDPKTGTTVTVFNLPGGETFEFSWPGATS